MSTALSDQLCCIVCLELCSSAVETACCTQLLCEQCALPLRFCPYCRSQPFQFCVSSVIRRVIGTFPVECECGVKTTKGEMEIHLKECRTKERRCVQPGCKFVGWAEPLLEHIVSEHGKEVVSFFTTPAPTDPKPAERDCIGKQGIARIGATGKYYCGQRLNGQCVCCNGFCGPDFGCNCEKCMQLDIQARALPKGYLVNPAGRICRRGQTGNWYCGAKVMEGVPRCNGFCGPTNGPQCGDCRKAEEQIPTRYSHIAASWR